MLLKISPRESPEKTARFRLSKLENISKGGKLGTFEVREVGSLSGGTLFQFRDF